MLQACGVGSRSARVVRKVETREHTRHCKAHNKPQFSLRCQTYSPFAVGYPLSTQFVPRLSEM